MQPFLPYEIAGEHRRRVQAAFERSGSVDRRPARIRRAIRRAERHDRKLHAPLRWGAR